MHSKMLYLKDVLEIHYILGTMSNIIKQKVEYSSLSTYGVKDQNIA